MDVKSAGRRIMRTVAKGKRFSHNILPRKFLSVKIYGTRMADKFHSLVKRAVRLYVKHFVLNISCIIYLLRIIIISSCTVYLQFNAVKTYVVFFRQFVEHGLWLVVIIVDVVAAVTAIVITFTAIGIIAAPVSIV